jgi:hypothetical protein
MNFQPQTSSTGNQVPEAIKNTIQSVNDGVMSVKTGVANTLDKFSQQAQAGVGASSQFLQSNTIIAKFAFLILVLIAFMFLLYLGIILMNYFSSANKNPYLIHGMIDGTNTNIIKQDPTDPNSIYIQRSNNQASGIEYTWSVWLYINDIRNDKKTGENYYNNIFNKGDTYYDSVTGLASVNNAPGLYLSNSTNELLVIVDTVVSEDPNTIITIPDVPIRKWVHVAIRVKNTIVDVYINGVVSNRLLLSNVPKQNYENVNICANGGFTGNLSNLRYFDSALNVFDINSIVSYGPNLNLVGSSASANTGTNYISSYWYSYNN